MSVLVMAVIKKINKTLLILGADLLHEILSWYTGMIVLIYHVLKYCNLLSINLTQYQKTNMYIFSVKMYWSEWSHFVDFIYHLKSNYSSS